MIPLLKQLVETESPSHEKPAVDRVGAIVTDECRRLGAQLEIHPQAKTGDHIVARFPGKKEGRGILILSHMDTVFPLGTLQKMPFYEKDGKIFGPGVLDMKGGIVIALSAISATLSSGGPAALPITALFTSDEEIGSHTSRALIESLARDASIVFVMESGLVDGALKTWRKGVGGFDIHVHGRAAHAGGDHEKGRNAIEEMAHQVIAIQKMTDYSRQTTLNVGVIHGGTVSNVVPEDAFAEVDVRVMQPGEWERIAAGMQNLKPVLDGTTLNISGRLNRPPMPYNKANQNAFEKTYQIAREKLGMQIIAGGSGGASDGNFVAPLGVPVLDGMGAYGEGYHSEREYIFSKSLAERANLLAALIQNW